MRQRSVTQRAVKPDPVAGGCLLQGSDYSALLPF